MVLLLLMLLLGLVSLVRHHHAGYNTAVISGITHKGIVENFFGPSDPN
jgi:hypothetical protein